MTTTSRDVIVIGGGISGLTAAWRLKQAGIDVCVLESEHEVGGAMRTERRDGFLLEKGPFNVIVRDGAFERLLKDLGNEIEVIEAARIAAQARYVLHDDRLYKVPSNPLDLVTTPLLTLGGKARLLRGLVASRRPRADDDSIDNTARRRFGPQVADRLVSALCVGIFAADSRDLSLSACLPSAAEIDTQSRSPLGFMIAKHLRQRRNGKTRRRWRGLISFRQGLGELPKILAAQLRQELFPSCRALSIRKVGRRYEISCSIEGGIGPTFRTGHLVLAVPKSATATLLVDVAPEISEHIKVIPSSGLVVLNLGFERGHVGHPLDGYGFLVPATSSSFPLLGVLWADSVFERHAPPNRRLLRVFMGGSRRPDMLTKRDKELVDIACTALRDLLRLTSEPLLIDVCRWPDAIPQYRPGHVQRVVQINQQLRQHPGLHLIGNYLDGISINDCVRTASRAASEIARHIEATKNSHQRQDTNDHSAATRQTIAATTSSS
ncbi:MAG: protoporphyrinogen oxidase [Phycisphaerales bacterium]